MCFLGALSTSRLFETLKFTYLRASGKEQASTADSAAVGLLSGVVTAVLTNPLDVANSRMKTKAAHAAGPLSLRSVLRGIAQQEGPQALMAGVGTRAYYLLKGIFNFLGAILIGKYHLGNICCFWAL